MRPLFESGSVAYTRVQVATEPDVATEPEPPLEPPPSSLAGSVDLNRDSEEPEGSSPHSTSIVRPPPLRGCPAYDDLTVREKLDVSLLSQQFADRTDRSLRFGSIVQISSSPKPFYRYCFGGMGIEVRQRFARSRKKNGCTALGWSLYNKVLTG